MGLDLGSDNLLETARRPQAAAPPPAGGPARPARRLSLFAPLDDGRSRAATASSEPPAAGNGEEILTRLDELSRLLVRRDAERGSCDEGRVAALEASVLALVQRQDAEIPTLRESMGARVVSVEAVCLRALSDAEARIGEALSMQNQLLEALLSEKERSDAALALLRGGLAAAVTEAEAQARTNDQRLAAIEARAQEADLRRGDATITGDVGLLTALSACTECLDEALLHFEGAAIDHLSGGGRSIKAALQDLAERIAAVDSRLGGTAVDARADLDDDAPPP